MECWISRVIYHVHPFYTVVKLKNHKLNHCKSGVVCICNPYGKLKANFINLQKAKKQVKEKQNTLENQAKGINVEFMAKNGY